jgi:hypothetical protein
VRAAVQTICDAAPVMSVRDAIFEACPDMRSVSNVDKWLRALAKHPYDLTTMAELRAVFHDAEEIKKLATRIMDTTEISQGLSLVFVGVLTTLSTHIKHGWLRAPPCQHSSASGTSSTAIVAADSLHSTRETGKTGPQRQQKPKKVVRRAWPKILGDGTLSDGPFLDYRSACNMVPTLGKGVRDGPSKLLKLQAAMEENIDCLGSNIWVSAQGGSGSNNQKYKYWKCAVPGCQCILRTCFIEEHDVMKANNEGNGTLKVAVQAGWYNLLQEHDTGNTVGIRHCDTAHAKFLVTPPAAVNLSNEDRQIAIFTTGWEEETGTTALQNQSWRRWMKYVEYACFMTPIQILRLLWNASNRQHSRGVLPSRIQIEKAVRQYRKMQVPQAYQALSASNGITPIEIMGAFNNTGRYFCAVTALSSLHKTQPGQSRHLSATAYDASSKITDYVNPQDQSDVTRFLRNAKPLLRTSIQRWQGIDDPGATFAAHSDSNGVVLGAKRLTETHIWGLRDVQHKHGPRHVSTLIDGVHRLVAQKDGWCVLTMCTTTCVPDGSTYKHSPRFLLISVAKGESAICVSKLLFTLWFMSLVVSECKWMLVVYTNCIDAHSGQAAGWAAHARGLPRHLPLLLRCYPHTAREYDDAAIPALKQDWIKILKLRGVPASNRDVEANEDYRKDHALQVRRFNMLRLARDTEEHTELGNAIFGALLCSSNHTNYLRKLAPMLHGPFQLWFLRAAAQFRIWLITPNSNVLESVHALFMKLSQRLRFKVGHFIFNEVPAYLRYLGENLAGAVVRVPDRSECMGPLEWQAGARKYLSQVGTASSPPDHRCFMYAATAHGAAEDGNSWYFVANEYFDWHATSTEIQEGVLVSTMRNAAQWHHERGLRQAASAKGQEESGSAMERPPAGALRTKAFASWSDDGSSPHTSATQYLEQWLRQWAVLRLQEQIQERGADLTPAVSLAALVGDPVSAALNFSLLHLRTQCGSQSRGPLDWVCAGYLPAKGKFDLRGPYLPSDNSPPRIGM